MDEARRRTGLPASNADAKAESIDAAARATGILFRRTLMAVGLLGVAVAAGVPTPALGCAVKGHFEKSPQQEPPDYHGPDYPGK